LVPGGLLSFLHHFLTKNRKVNPKVPAAKRTVGQQTCCHPQKKTALKSLIELSERFVKAIVMEDFIWSDIDTTISQP
jgi:hypothetical protein